VRETVAALISASYSDDKVQAFLRFAVERSHLNQLAAIGNEILQNARPIPYSCTALSAMWVGISRDRTMLPVQQVAGDLFVDGHPAFAGGADADSLPAIFDRSRPDWDGHSWLALGDYIGDLSMCRTAYQRPPSSRLRNAVIQRFGLGKGLLLANAADFEANGFSYRPKYVLTEQQINSLMLGARELLT
jgi:hypothetical protein